VDRLRAILEPLLVPDGVVALPEGEEKDAVVARLGRLACAAAGVAPGAVEAVLEGLRARERVLSTGIGLGIAVPHVRNAHVPTEVMRVGRSRSGLAFDAIDGKPVHAVFTILMPPGRHRRHVEVLGAIAAALKDPARREAAFAAEGPADFVHRMLGR
jgi:mannitol/fructose-specific phosphotransferase system IIA component (Ntr-type)